MAVSILAGMTILMIGDSHLATPEFLIASLHDTLVAQGASVHSLGMCGVMASDWLKATPKECGGAERRDKGKTVMLGGKAATVPISQLLATDKPDLVLIVMGDTMASYKNPSVPKAWLWQETTALAKGVSANGTRCVWIGPNWGSEGGKYGKTFARVELTSNFLAKNVAPCSYIDSLKLSRKGQWATIDGQHLTIQGYQSWSDAINKALLQDPVVKGVGK